MMLRAVCMVLLSLWVDSLVGLQAAEDAGRWLDRMATAAQTLNYSGIFVYQGGEIGETSRIVHAVDAGGVRERLEVLDGSPREVVRDNEETRCFLPNDRRVVIEKRNARRIFPALIAKDAAVVGEHYALRKGGIERVAGMDAQVLVLDPRDGWRYGYRFWAETKTGLIVKARTLDENGKLVEQFSFTQLSFDNPIDQEQLKPRSASGAADWREENLRTAALRAGDANWHFGMRIPGFVKMAEMRRQLRENGPEVIQVVFSDGLAAISVFIAPNTPSPPITALGTSPKLGASAQGAVHIFSRQVADHLVTVLGEVPPVTVRSIAEGIEYRKP